MICWSCFTWEAAATLFTGVLAVCAALVVGLRQQKILDRQVALQALAIREKLFDRRYPVFDAAMRLAAAVLHPTLSAPTRERLNRFNELNFGIEFLFDDEMAGFLNGLASDSSELLERYESENAQSLRNDEAWKSLNQKFKEMKERFRPWLSLKESK